MLTIVDFKVLLRHDPSNRSNVIIAGAGRKFLNSANGTPLSSGAQLLKGFFQSVRPTSLGPVINLDVAASPYLQSGSLLRVCNMIVGRDGGGGGGGGRGGRGGNRGGRGGRGGGQGGSGGHPAGAFNEGELRELKSKLRGGRVRVTHRVDRKVTSFSSFKTSQNFDSREFYEFLLFLGIYHRFFRSNISSTGRFHRRSKWS